MTDEPDLISRIDSVTAEPDGTCPQCHRHLSDAGPSEFYCSEACQEKWHAARAVELVDADRGDRWYLDDREVSRPAWEAAVNPNGAACFWYDRSGIPINDIHEVERLFTDMSYKRVARTKVMSAADPTKVFDVSTVWLGCDHSFGFGPPLIFETMVFGEGSALDEEQRRYCTENEARSGHTEMVTVVAATLDDPIVMDTEGER